MLSPKVHTGCYLLCRTIALPFRTVGVQTVIEDPNGDIRVLALYSYPRTENVTVEYLDGLLPIGTILAIREPYFRPATQGPNPIIRVDSPTDLVFLDSSSEYLRGVTWRTCAYPQGAPSPPRSVEGWKVLGTRHFKSGYYFSSAMAYSRGLILDENAFLLRLNRAEAYLRLGYYSAAVADAEHVLGLLDIPLVSRHKALARSGKGLYALGDFLSAERKFKEWLCSSTPNPEASEWISRCQARYRETETGKYDFADLYKQRAKCGPIEVKPTDGRGGGRGVVATRDIKLGELLVVAKPFASAFVPNKEYAEYVMSLNMRTKVIDSHCRTALVSRAIDKLYGNPDLSAQVYGLYAGPKCDKPPPAYPLPVGSSPSRTYSSVGSVDVDSERVEAVCTYNSFSLNSEDPSQPGKSIVETSYMGNDSPSALYLLPSLFNHACQGNARWECFGDVMAIRAARNISAGEEITISYCWSFSHSKRQEILTKHLPQGCACTLCQQDISDGKSALARRDKLAAVFDSRSDLEDMSLERRRSLLKEIEATYTGNEPLRIQPALAKAHEAVATMLFRQADHSQVLLKATVNEHIKELEADGVKVLQRPFTGKRGRRDGSSPPIALGCIPVDHSSRTLSLLVIAACLGRLQDSYGSRQWLKAALLLCDAAMGGSKDLFLLRYHNALEGYGLLDLAKSSL
ncbi:hypothetical protein JAAARDRAFT_77211 [Jaapia argillacea MUCL 33604]|uniref:SET domain-containing protein n=1 Tax=Jaapia argillacea MUCL 33604 TaxID=933084 RepID=A0A067Q2K8_9AGAM|nr:hypothetical protein JAAARDRAFT_77211 [Jaapia argillacea MUCL 33604]